MTRRSRAGFTLAELAIVVLIVAILIAILFPKIRQWQQRRATAAPAPAAMHRAPAGPGVSTGFAAA